MYSNIKSILLEILHKNIDKNTYDYEISKIRSTEPSRMNKIDRFICFYPDIFYEEFLNIKHQYNSNNYIIIGSYESRKYINISIKSIINDLAEFLNMVELIDSGTNIVIGFTMNNN